MNETYLNYEIVVDQLELPIRTYPHNLEIGTISNSTEYSKLLDIFLDIFPNSINSEKEGELRSFRNPNWEGTYIAKIDSKIIGFLITGIIPFINPTAYILYLGVLKRYRSKGIATYLLNELKKVLKKKGIKKIQARIRNDNYIVLNYIKYLGFKQI